MSGRLLTALAVVLLLIAATTAAAATLGAGVRQGSISEPDGSSESVALEVIDGPNGTKIVMTEDGGGQVTFDDVRFEDDDLVFTWKTGEAEIHCTLAPVGEDAYAGPCGDLRLAMGAPSH